MLLEALIILSLSCLFLALDSKSPVLLMTAASLFVNERSTRPLPYALVLLLILTRL